MTNLNWGEKTFHWLRLWVAQTALAVVVGSILSIFVSGSGLPRDLYGWLPGQGPVLLDNLVPVVVCAAAALLVSRRLPTWASAGAWVWLVPTAMFVYAWQSVVETTPFGISDVFRTFFLKHPNSEGLYKLFLTLPCGCGIGYSAGMGLALWWDSPRRASSRVR
jgi:hypothetical protein